MRCRVSDSEQPYSNGLLLLHPILLHSATLGTSTVALLRIQPDALAQMSEFNTARTSVPQLFRKCSISSIGRMPEFEANKGSDRVFTAPRSQPACATRRRRRCRNHFMNGGTWCVSSKIRAVRTEKPSSPSYYLLVVLDRVCGLKSFGGVSVELIVYLLLPNNAEFYQREYTSCRLQHHICQFSDALWLYWASNVASSFYFTGRAVMSSKADRHIANSD